MARITLALSIVFTPAYHALVECATAIAEAHGEERAAAWVSDQIGRDFDLFCKLRAVDEPPKLRLIQGGRDGL